MSSHRALKTNAEAKSLLIEQIERYAVQNGIDKDDLYDVREGSNFAIELNELERRLMLSEISIEIINDTTNRLIRLGDELMKMQKYVGIPEKWRDFHTWKFYYDHVHPIHYIEAQRKSNLKRRIWELRTFLDACHNHRISKYPEAD